MEDKIKFAVHHIERHNEIIESYNNNEVLIIEQAFDQNCM